MTFKKHNWIKYGRKGMKCEISVKDEDDRALDFFRYQTSDKKAEKNVFSILKRKYGINFSPEIKSEESINVKKLMREDLGIDC